MTMVWLVAHPNGVDGALYMVTVVGPGQWHGLHQFVELFFAGAGAGLGKLLQHALIGHSDHTSIHRVVAVILAVFFAIQAQDIVQSEFAP